MPYHTETLIVPARGAMPRLTPVILDTPRHDELLVEIHAISAGIVLRASPTSDIAPGDRVILSYNFCRTCAQYVSGHVAYCENILLLNFGGTRADASRTITLPQSPACTSAEATEQAQQQ
ncbi:hypothetical protein BDV19DRAFT_388227 [Aspergillus venezuelensis]